jgi:tricorn protease
MRSIYLYSLESGESTPITDDMSIADNPVFDRNGKYLYFYSCTDISLRLSWNELSDMLSKPTNNLYLIILNSVEPSPFIPESDEEIVKDQKKDKNGKKDNIKEESGKIKIDLSNIEKRIIPFDMPRGHYGNIQAGTENIFYYIAPGSRSRSADLHMYNIVSNKDEIILENVSNYMVSADGNKIMYKKRGAIAIADAGRPIITGKGKLNTTGIKTWMVPELEWKQILHEAWRFNRDMFYDPGMHGIDWSAMLKKYEVYLPYVGHRDDLNYVIQQLLSELAVGHCHAAGGELPQIDRVPGGLLGADYEIDSGFYRIKHIYEGESWNPDLRAPLNVPGVLVKEGDYILAVNGRELKAPCNIYSLFQNTAGKQVVLKVNDKPEMNGAREVTVVPIRNESDLRHRDWLDNTRKMVNKLTYGKVGYVYIPDTMRSGFDSFNRYYFSQLDKEGLIIDERYNGGGAFADYMVENMNRKIINWVQPRYGQSITIPGAANYGQKVMLISEMAGSGGDYLPFAFRAHKIGKIIGRTTWGGLVGVTGCPPLMDGGIVTSPNVGFVGLDGKFSIENEGVPPDIDIEIYPTDFKAGKDTQLLKAIEVIMEEIKDHKLPELKFDSFPRGR